MTLDVAKQTWIKVPPPYPPDEVFFLAERTAAGLSTLSSVKAEQKLNRTRQIALQELGRTTLHALASYVVYTQMHVRSAANLSRILTSLTDEVLQSLAESLVNESQLIKGKAETNGLAESKTRLIGAFGGIIGAYCFADMCDELETMFIPMLTAAIYKRHPHIKDGLFEPSDYKTALQEFTQMRSKSQPVYELVQEEGPDHDKSFTVRVTAKNIGTAVGTGRSKKAAEQAAAKFFLLPFIQQDPSIIRIRENRGTRVIQKSVSPPNISRMRQKEVPIDAVIKKICHDDKLLQQALTHTSIAREFQISDTTGLATLGDWLFQVYLTKTICKATWDSAAINETHLIRSIFYRENLIERLFDEWELQNCVVLGRGQTHEGCTSEMKENFIQAVAGAGYIDSETLSAALQRMDDNLEHHIKLTLDKFRDSSKATATIRHIVDPKTTLQELTQISRISPEYTLNQEIGPSHKPQFKSGVRIKSSVPNAISPWLMGAFAPTKTKAEESAARAYLGLAREWIKGGMPAALNLFQNQSRASIVIVDQIAELLLQTIQCANAEQQDFLERRGLSLIASTTDDLHIVVKRLSQVDGFLQTQKRELEFRPKFLTKAVTPLQMTTEIENLIGSLSEYLDEVKPEQWAETGIKRRTILERLLHLTNLLKHLALREERRDLTDLVRELINSGDCICNEINAIEPFLVCGMRGFLDWLFTELCSELTEESIIIRLFPTDRTLEIEAPNSMGPTKSPSTFVDLIVKSSDALLFGAGVQSCALTDYGLRFEFIDSYNGPLVTYFLQEGREKLAPLIEFGLAFHDIRNIFTAIEILWGQSIKDNARRYHCYAEIQEKLQSLRGTTAALIIVSQSYSEPTKQTVNLNDFMNDFRQKAIQTLSSSIDFITYGDHASGDAWLEIDTDLMVCAFDNILKNARESVQHQSAQIRLEWVIDINSQVVLISISDSGPGMSEDVLEQVLLGNYTSKSKLGGFGLGLRSAREIVKKHGGHLWINSKLGAGTHVNIELPLLNPEFESPEPIADASLNAEDDIQV